MWNKNNQKILNLTNDLNFPSLDKDSMRPIRSGDRLWVSLYIYINEFINDLCTDKIETGGLIYLEVIFKKYFVIHSQLFNLMPISSHIEQQHCSIPWENIFATSLIFSPKLVKIFFFSMLLYCYMYVYMYRYVSFFGIGRNLAF